MNRNHGGLHSEGDHESDEQQAFRVRAEVHVHEVTQQEGTVAIALGVHVDADNGGQHNQTRGQGIQQELDGGVATLCSTKTTDEEEHRDEGGLKEEIEEQDVSGGEYVEGETLDGQRKCQEGAFAQLVFTEVLRKGIEQDQRGENGGEEHEAQPDTIHTERVEGVNLGNPLV